MPEPPVTLTVADNAATITLNRPDSLNSWDKEFGEHLRDALADCAADDAIRAVMITGAGRAFSSGADLREHRADSEGAPDLGVRLGELYNPSILAIRKLPKPVLASVNGAAAGIGCALALACDLIVAAESSFFLLAFVNIGLVPDGGATATVAARIGASRAAEMAMLGERVLAPQALEWGLINRVVPDAELATASDELLARLAGGPTLAYANIKRLLNRSSFRHFAKQLDAEANAQREQGRSTDFIEGVIAFSEKRPPRFSGT
jgi:2-(1,2-epoxy-1,2-dihydrophenyl)acetyl-CoA isomerase